jgi:ATP-dependent helicase/nuclease subunit B
MPDEQAIRLATSLANLLDLAQTERVELGRLKSLLPDELAEHWQEIATFLEILDDAWPRVLEAECAVDPATWRNVRLSTAVSLLQREAPAGPVIAAGITGTVPVVADLLIAVLGLDQGFVVLPGFDPEIEPITYAEIGPTHPLFAIKRLLDRIGLAPNDVALWPELAPMRAAPARRSLIFEIMRPAATAEAWQRLPPPVDEALDGLAVAECPSHGEEALLVALKLRQSIETPGRTAALVTSDRQLARRVTAELDRFSISVDDSAGVPLDQTPPGSLLLLVAHALLGDGGPVALLSALKHPLAKGGMPPGGLRRLARQLERQVLRGPRRGQGLQPILSALYDRRDPSSDVLIDWLSRFAASAAPMLKAIGGELASLVAAHVELVEWLARDETGRADELWAKETGEVARDFVGPLMAAAVDEPTPPGSAYPAVLAVLMAGEAVRPNSKGHPRLMILGQLEARMVEADTVIVAGLNEGTWPRTVEPGPWLNRQMRDALGLPPLDFQIGIAAHDLLMAATAADVLLTRSIKDQSGSPTVPSRWLQRLDTVTRAVGRRNLIELPANWLAWAAALDAPKGSIRPCSPPAPCPPLHARPTDLWVTEIEMLMRDPYSVYARRILDLRELAPLDADPGAGEHGEIIHDVLERFVKEYPAELPPEPEKQLVELGLKAFSRFADQPEVQVLWWPRFRLLARWFVAEEQSRRAKIRRIAAESQGTLKVGANGRYTIRARADRLELRESGGLGIADYKTGTIPSAADIRAGLNPQLPLEAAIAANGGFPGVAGAIEALEHWPLKAGPKPSAIKPAAKPEDLAALIENARDGVGKLFDLFADPNTPFFAVPRPEIAPRHNAYEHLARVKEWRGGGD